MAATLRHIYPSTWEETSALGKTLDELAAMAMTAVGRDGKASDYVLNIARKLNAVGVEDPTVIAFAAAVRNAQQSGNSFGAGEIAAQDQLTAHREYQRHAKVDIRIDTSEEHLDGKERG